MAFNADKLLVNLLLEQNIVHTLVSCAEVKKKKSQQSFWVEFGHLQCKLLCNDINICFFNYCLK